ncbi:sugar ABC transporter substrate-binding protein [Tessaracoccus antarcticus]|uniref:Extracellular solute-binding protein n=1 Tax=Tessaracoccus antarcticus TaxID=2479848 RepID=A0A3M0GGG2_9ACTN|nr:extracellular solute-binding protein [Tessaracoccus antarcticus]RMB60229.1 extracellular solute-binding protein [Tessaracoccus antarcticus]
MNKLAVAAVMAAALAVTACGGNASGPAGPQEPKDKGPLVVLTYAQGDQLPMYQEFFDKCSADTGYKFEQLQVDSENIFNKAIQLTASGDGPAAILADNQMVAGLANAGVLSPISIGDLDPNDFVEGPFKSGQFEGRQYGLPVGNNGEVVVYNKGLLDEAGLEAPKSWADLTEAAKKLTTDGRYGFAQTFVAGETLSWNFWAQLWSAGGSIADLGSPEAVEAATFWASFLKDGYAPQAQLQWQSTDIIGEVAAGRVAMAQVGTWTLSNLLEQAKANGIEIGMTTQVSKDGSAPIVPFGGEVLSAGSSVSGDELQAVSECIVSWSTDVEGLVKRTKLLGYLPSYIPAQEAALRESPFLTVLSEQLKTSRGRTEEVGADYQSRTLAISTALQKIATGDATAQDAMTEAQASAAKGE